MKLAVRFAPVRDSAAVFAVGLAALSVPTFLGAHIIQAPFGRTFSPLWFDNALLLGSVFVGAFGGGFAAYRICGGNQLNLMGRILSVSVLATVAPIVAVAALLAIAAGIMVMGLAMRGSANLGGLPAFFVGAVFFGFLKVGLHAACVATAWTVLYCGQAAIYRSR